MTDITEQALVIPQREKHDWSQAVMRYCDFCQQWALTVRHSDGGCICASCCDAEYTSKLEVANAALVEALEKALRAQPCEHSMFWDASGVKRCSKCDRTELESRTVTVKLPKDHVDDADLFGWGVVVVPLEALKGACADAGITVEITTAGNKCEGE